MTDETADADERLAALRRDFARVMAARLDEIEKLWRRVSDGDWDDEPARRLAFCVHRLCGTAGSFGYPEVSRAALALEQRLTTWLEAGREPSADELARGRELVADMRRGAAEVPTSDSP